MASLRDIVTFCDTTLRIDEITDWDNALNGLQIENSGRVLRIGAAVDVSTRTLSLAAERAVDFLIVHHGLFWQGLQPVTRTFRRQLQIAFKHDVAVYSAHLPLDVHPTIGNNALLAAAVGLRSSQPFLEEKGQMVGVRAKHAGDRHNLLAKVERVLGGNVRAFNFGPNKT